MVHPPPAPSVFLDHERFTKTFIPCVVKRELILGKDAEKVKSVSQLVNPLFQGYTVPYLTYDKTIPRARSEIILVHSSQPIAIQTQNFGTLVKPPSVIENPTTEMSAFCNDGHDYIFCNE